MKSIREHYILHVQHTFPVRNLDSSQPFLRQVLMMTFSYAAPTLRIDPGDFHRIARPFPWSQPFHRFVQRSRCHICHDSSASIVRYRSHIREFHIITLISRPRTPTASRYRST